jgi:hypothetical protein
MYNWLRLLLIASLTVTSGCQSWSQPPHYREPEKSFWPLLVRERQREILDGQYDRARLRQEIGSPTIDDGEEWIYVGKFLDSRVMPLDMLLAITASLNDPTWKTVVVTFDEKGIVQGIRVGSTESAIADAKKTGILFGVYYDRAGRARATTGPATRDTGPPAAAVE